MAKARATDKRATAAPEAGLGWRSPEYLTMATVGLATALMLQSTRVFLSYLVFVVDQSNRGQLAAAAFGTFLLFLFGAVVVRLGPGRAWALALAGLVGCRLLLQFWMHPEARLVLGAAVIVCWGWFLPVALRVNRAGAARGVALGMLLDLLVRFLFGTVDLPWMPGVGRHVATVVLVAALIAAAVAALRRSGPAAYGLPSPASLLGIGPGLVLFHLVTGNLGTADVQSGLATLLTIWLFVAGLAIGVAVQFMRGEIAPPGRPVPARGVAIILGILTAAAFGVAWQWDGVADLAFLPLAAISTQLVVLAAHGSARPAERASPWLAAVWLTVGMVAHAALLFAYFTWTALPWLLLVAIAGLTLGAALAIPRGEALPALVASPAVRVTAVAGVAVVALGLVLHRPIWFGVEKSETLPRELTVMTYNIQAGFPRDNRWDLEGTAEAIEAVDPDVVLLQEVGRGWPLMTGADGARWLSNRLDMNLVWGPASGDDLWGNAILTRGEILVSDLRRFSETSNLKRSVLGAIVPTEEGEVWLYVTHLDNPEDAEDVRVAQTEELVAATEGALPAILGGDFNAVPDSPTVSAILAAGFIDTGATLPTTEATSQDGRRIDYVFIRGPMGTLEAFIPETWASDHRPMVARVRLGGR